MLDSLELIDGVRSSVPKFSGVTDDALDGSLVGSGLSWSSEDEEGFAERGGRADCGNGLSSKE